MSFLLQEDFKTLIRDQTFNQVIDYNNSLFGEAMMMAQSQIESYIRPTYDVANIFNKTGSERNPLIVMYMIDLTLYHLHSRITPRQIPEIRIERYNTALMWLDKVADGKLNPDLPRTETPDGEVQTKFRFGSNEKLGHQW